LTKTVKPFVEMIYFFRHFHLQQDNGRKDCFL